MATNQTYLQSRWSLADLFPGLGTPEIQTGMDEMKTIVSAFEGYRDQLKPDIAPDKFMAIVRELEELNRKGWRLFGFASLSFAGDTQDQAAQTFMAQMQQFFAELQNRILFFSLWWKGLEDGDAQRLMAVSGDYRYWLQEMRNYKPHTLSEPEEKIINIKDVTGSSALVRLYDTITNRYVFKVEVDGEVKEMTRGELMVYARHHDPELRARAYQELYRVYGEDGDILGQIYQTLVRDWRNENMDLRSFASPMAVRNLANDIPDEVVNTLLDVSERNSGIFQRFFQLKARLLGMERLRRYDIYAPVAKADKAYGFDAAAQQVLESFEQFSPKVAEMARRVFDENHLDSEVRKGKRGGAFCSTIGNDLTPWVLVNFQGRPDDVATLAHELGHAIHSMLAAHHTLFTSFSSLPLAETASTFAEMVLIDKLLAEETDAGVRRDLLFKQVDDNYATIMRQIFFALFERHAHEMIASGASVSELAEAYLGNLRVQFGDTVDVAEEFKWEWVSIPHIYHTPFYVYAYAFGQLLVLALYQQFKKEGESFKPRYLEILAAGGSASPMEILAKAGIDAAKPEFWQGGFDAIAGMIDQLEKISA